MTKLLLSENFRAINCLKILKLSRCTTEWPSGVHWQDAGRSPRLGGGMPQNLRPVTISVFCIFPDTFRVTLAVRGPVQSRLNVSLTDRHQRPAPVSGVACLAVAELQFYNQTLFRPWQ